MTEPMPRSSPPTRRPMHVRCLGWEALPFSAAQLVSALGSSLSEMHELGIATESGSLSVDFSAFDFRFTVHVDGPADLMLSPVPAAAVEAQKDDSSGMDDSSSVDVGASLDSWGALANSTRATFSVEVFAAEGSPSGSLEARHDLDVRHHVDVRRLQGPILMCKHAFETLRELFTAALQLHSCALLADYSPGHSKRQLESKCQLRGAHSRLVMSRARGGLARGTPRLTAAEFVAARREDSARLLRMSAVASRIHRARRRLPMKPSPYETEAEPL